MPVALTECRSASISNLGLTTTDFTGTPSGILFAQRMGVYPGSTARFAPRTDCLDLKTSTYRCRFRRTICANNNFAVMNIRSVKVSLHDFISGKTRTRNIH